jgi:hypothetical protein
VALDSVGKNLQDRYEAGESIIPGLEGARGATFTSGDGTEWADHRRGVYQQQRHPPVIARSHPGAPSPDCISTRSSASRRLPARLLDLLRDNPNVLTGSSQGAHEQHGWRSYPSQRRSAGTTAHSLQVFDEGNDIKRCGCAGGRAGFTTARRFADGLKKNNLIAAEEVPTGITDDRLEEFVRERAWGHHASCTCRIGDSKDGGVLSTDFKVHGVTGLRVVDASIFPRIPGFFIVSAIYMVGEKAADVIASEAHASTPLARSGPSAPKECHVHLASGHSAPRCSRALPVPR